MQTQPQFRHGASGGAQPLWQRVLALACLLLVGIASSAQAVHTHGQWLPRSDKHASQPADISQIPTNEAGCLLCMAMHSAMPVVANVQVPVTLVGDLLQTVTAQDRVPDTPWHFAMFSRPPPAVETL